MNPILVLFQRLPLVFFWLCIDLFRLVPNLTAIDREPRCGTDGRRPVNYFILAYSALAAMRMGMLGSASFQSARKS